MGEGGHSVKKMRHPVIYAAKIEAGGRAVFDDSSGQLFPWWSLTKTVLAACALELVSRGALALDQRLPGRRWTLRHLLQHRAGVPNYGGLAAYHDAVARGDRPWPVDELLERVGGELDFAPGTGWSYSNVGYVFVRQLIEEAMDAELGAAMRGLVFDRLDLASVRLVAAPADLDRTAWGNAHGYHPGWVYHGLVVGTAMDAARLVDGLVSGRLLAPALLDAMTTPHHIGGALPERPWESHGYGLGLMIGRMSEAGFAIGHSGVGPDSVSATYTFPDRQPCCTVAAFAQDQDESGVEHAVAGMATQA